MHPAVLSVVERIRDDTIGGAADTAKETIRALLTLAEESQASSPAALVEEIDQAALALLRVMPSLAPPLNALHRLLAAVEAAEAARVSLPELKTVIAGAGADFLTWAEDALGKVAQYGAERIQNGQTVFMYSMSSTVWRILRAARAGGKTFGVVVTESRPANEGLSTVTEMHKAGIPVSVSVDACIGELVPECDLVFVGADAISSSGAALCKTGTYPTALVARSHGVPFYVAADTLKFDPGSLLGLPFRSDPIRRLEVLSEDYPPEAQVVGHLFDQTPPELISAIVTETGWLHPAASAAVIAQLTLSKKLNALLPAWSREEL
jgi:ribose 1,5-bisphosphate isomerase